MNEPFSPKKVCLEEASLGIFIGSCIWQSRLQVSLPTPATSKVEQGGGWPT